MKYFILAAASLALVACGQNTEHDHAKMDHSDAHSEGEHTGIKVSSAYVIPPFPGRDVAGGFFQITNHGADDRLILAASSISDAVEIHTHTEENGVMKMRKVDGVDLAKGETIAFQPGSYHLMMYGANIPEGTETVSVTLTYENAEPMTLEVPLGEPKPSDSDHSEMDHSKMGH